jgi:DNA-binding IclR family transcriptional regulator
MATGVPRTRNVTRPTVDSDLRPASQTLDRGLRVLEHITESLTPLTVAEVARDVGMHRSITYRMLRTLEDHGLIARDELGRFQAGAGLAVLAGRFTPALRAVAGRHLLKLAVATEKTAFLVVRHGDEAVTIEVVEPPAAAAHVSYRPGLRHPITTGAPGIALLAGEPPHADERPAVTQARSLGWATSTSEVIEGFRAVAAPVIDTSGVCRAAIAVVFAGSGNVSGVADRVMAHALALGLDL